MGSGWGEEYIRDQALNPFLYAMVMDRLTDEDRQESPWLMMFEVKACTRENENESQ